MEKLKSDLRVVEADLRQQDSARRSFLKSSSPSRGTDDHLVAFMEDLVVNAEMKRTRIRILLDHHAYNCLFCLRANLN